MDDYTRSRFIQAIDKFNNKDFFECHEILEDIWFDTHDDSKDFFQGLLHIAVGFYHLTKKNNHKGSIIQLNKAAAKLEGYDKGFNGIDLERLIKEIEDISKSLGENKIPKAMPEIVIL